MAHVDAVLFILATGLSEIANRRRQDQLLIVLDLLNDRSTIPH
jgi:hypothetical protein